MKQKNADDIPFNLISSYTPLGDQPKAISALYNNLTSGVQLQTLRGVTGSGKTYTIANVIEKYKKPTLVIAPNKTLAAQLYSEFHEFFPENRVRYFVSYYDYYQPEAYIPSSDTYIEKDSAINEEIDKMRHSATKALIEARDTIIVASVSCIYGLGAPEEYFAMMLFIEVGEVIKRDEILKKLVAMQYTRSEVEFKRGNFRVRGETIDIFPSDEDTKAFRIVFFGDEIEEIYEIDSITGKTLKKLSTAAVYPLSHFVTNRQSIEKAIINIRREMIESVKKLHNEGKAFEAQRLEQRTLYDLELLKEIGFCSGIENYSRHIAGRAEGTPPTTLIDYFPDDFLLVIDESHVTISQIGGMSRGDRARKDNLVNYGFRLPSARDNRPLTGDEFWERVGQTIFVSATPGDYELEKSGEYLIEQINRPTGLVDPEVSVRPALNQVDDLLNEAREAIARGERVLVTTLTKKMSEDLSRYFQELGIKCRYLHSDIDTVERVEILRGLRSGDFDVLIGINLLREGLDLVEVALVAILDADKEGFLRSTRSLIQTMGRAARNINGRVIMYADKITRSMKEALDEADRRRTIQREFNAKHGIIPQSARSPMQKSLSDEIVEELEINCLVGSITGKDVVDTATGEVNYVVAIRALRDKMFELSKNQEFEKAAEIRDKIILLEKKQIGVS